MVEILDIPADQYHADRSAVSKSWLDRLAQSPAHLKAYFDEPHKDTPALILGRLAHTIILEPDVAAATYAVAPEADKRTKAGKEAWAEFQAANADKEIISPADWALAERMRDAVMNHSAARKLIEKGVAERSVYWDEPLTGVRCKARADWLRDGLIVDLKTTQDASRFAFAKSVANYRYHVQQAHYCEGFEVDDFVFIAVEKAPPFGVAVYFASPEMRRKGKELRDRNLDTYAQCIESGEWPCYPGHIQEIELPSWAA